MVLPAPSTWDIVNGEVLATNVQPTPEPVDGVLEWGYEVTVKDRHGKSYSFLVGVPDSTTDVEFVSLPRYFETKPPLFGQGPKGDAGEAATVTVGTVTKGTEANVTNSGTSNDAILDFVLPKGDKGERGDGVPDGGTALQYIRKDANGDATEWATLDKGSVGLPNVDNTSDADKPLSNAVIQKIEQIESGEEGRLAEKLENPDSQLLGALNNLYLNKNTLFLTVTDFGAKADGESDCSTSVQEAIDAAQVRGISTVVFPPNTLHYRLQNVTLRAGVDLVGFGAKIRPFTYNAFRGLSNNSKGYGASISDVRLVGLEFRGDFSVTDSSAAVTLHHAQDVEFLWCRWVEAIRGGHAIDLAGCKGVKIYSCLFEGFNPPTGREYAEAIQIDHSTAISVSNMDSPSSYDGLPCENISVVNCQFRQYTKGGITYKAPNPIGSHMTTEKNHKDITMESCIVEGGWATGSTSTINAWVHFQGIDGLRVERNKFIGKGVAAHVIKILTYSTGISPQDYANPDAVGIAINAPANKNIRIVDNTFEGFTATSNTALITVNGLSDRYAKTLNVGKNYFVNNYPGSGTGNQGSASVSLAYVQGIKIQNNDCESVRSLLFANNVKNISISDNNLDGAYWVAVAVEGTASRSVSVRGNNFTRCGSCVYINQAKGIAVHENVIDTSLPGTSYAGYAQGCITFAESAGISSEGNNIMLDTAYVPNGILARTNTKSAIIANNVLIGMSTPVGVDGTSTVSQNNNIVA